MALTLLVATLAGSSCGGSDAVNLPPDGEVRTIQKCQDVEVISGDLRGTVDKWPGRTLGNVGFDYGRRNEAIWGGYWIDPVQEIFVYAVTEDAAAHRAALARLLPQGTEFDVVLVSRPIAQLREVINSDFERLSIELDAESAGISSDLNRISIRIPSATAEDLAYLAANYPQDLICLK